MKITQKPFYILLSLFIMITFLAGCSLIPSARKNQIAPAQLTSGQQDLINLLTAHHSEILLFDFATYDAFKNVEFWLELYEYGVMVERTQGIHMINPEPVPLDSQLAVIINSEQGFRSFQWTFIVSDNGIWASNRFESSPIESDVMGRAFGPILEPIEIEDGREIILYMSKFSRGGIRTFDDIQIFLDQPELLADYPYSFMIKARFSK